MSLTWTPINKNIGPRIFKVIVSLENLWWATEGRFYLLLLLVETWHAEQRITWLAAGTCSGFNFLPKFGGSEASWGWGYKGLIIWQLFLLCKGRSRVSQQSSSPELLSGVKLRVCGQRSCGQHWPGPGHWEPDSPRGGSFCPCLAMLPALEGNQCSGRNLLVPNTGKKICFLFDSYSCAGFSHFRVLSWLTVQPDQRQRWLKSSDGGSDGDIESRGGADPCSVAAKCSFLFLITVTSSLPSSKFLVTRWSPRSLSTQTMLGFCDPRAVSKLSHEAKPKQEHFTL